MAPALSVESAPALLHFDQPAKGFQTNGSVLSLAQAGVKNVPKDFIQPSEHRPNKEEYWHTEEIPVIDLQGLEGDAKSSILSTLASACQEWGFFQVINHGIKEELLQEMMKIVKEFFALPLEVKQKWAMSHYQGFGRFNTSDDTVADWVDMVGSQVAPISLRDDERRPTEPAAYREVEDAYSGAIKDFVLRLSGAISESLGLEPDYVMKFCGGEYAAALRLNCYPPCPDPDRVLGIASHSDGGMITVLIQDRGSGLQVEKDGRWVPVNAVENALIVNVGDLLQVMSNGKYKSANHRAVVDAKKERYSIVTFHMPSKLRNVTIGPAPALLGEHAPARYRTMSFPEYLVHYMQNKARGKGRVECLEVEQDS